ncbi:hypothetical protein CPB86DRAFT_835821 [Serendipita vermifera]|nr:hypothetical protein CPB86DRAFT_835821 [Serendipita vermifera]
MSTYPNSHTYTMPVTDFIRDEGDIFEMENNTLSTSPGMSLSFSAARLSPPNASSIAHIGMGDNNTFFGTSTSYQESGQIQGFLNSPTPPQHTNTFPIEPKMVPNTQPAHVSNISNLTVRFHTPPEAMSYLGTTSPMQPVDTFSYEPSPPSTYSSPTGMPTGMTSLDHDHGAGFMSPDMASSNMNWDHAQSAAVDFSSTRRRTHRQTSSHPHSFAPYTSSSLAQHGGSLAGGSGSNVTSSSVFPRDLNSLEYLAAGFTPEQIPAANNILQYLRQHPNTAPPATLISPELAEVHEGRGYCLIGDCYHERAAQKANPLYDPAAPNDPLRKRVDRLCPHIVDKHLNYRPFQCTLCPQNFALEYDLKRHENTHTPVSLPCPVPECTKTYTRNDNLQRHIAQKHPTYPLITRRSAF